MILAGGRDTTTLGDGFGLGTGLGARWGVAEWPLSRLLKEKIVSANRFRITMGKFEREL